MQISIRPMELKDLKEVLVLENRVFPKPWKLRDFEWEIRHNLLAIYRVALLQGTIIGYGGMWLTPHEAHLTTLAVHPDYRCRGIGSYMLSHFILLASFKGASQITLEVRLSNKKAQRFYARYGFQIQAIHPNYYTDEDAFIMQASLDSSQEIRN